MKRCSYLANRLVLPYLEDAPRGLDLVTGAPAGDEGARWGGICEIDRKSVIQHAACAGRRHRPTVSTTTLVEPYFDPVESGAQPIRRDTDPNAHGKASFCLGDHEPGACSHSKCSISVLLKASHTALGKSTSLECRCRPAYAPGMGSRSANTDAFSQAFRPHVGLDHGKFTSRFGRKGLDHSVGWGPQA